MLCTEGLKKVTEVDPTDAGQCKGGENPAKGRLKTMSLTPWGRNSVAGSLTVLGRGAKKKPARCPAVSIHQCANQWRPSYGGIYAESQKVARYFMPNRGASSCAFNATKIIKPHKNPMGPPKPADNGCQPEANQIRAHHTVRIHFNRSAIEAPLTLLPISKSQQHDSEHRIDCVLKVGDQLNRQQRKAALPPAANKSGDGHPHLVKPGKQLNGISPVCSDRSVTLKTAADRTSAADNG